MRWKIKHWCNPRLKHRNDELRSRISRGIDGATSRPQEFPRRCKLSFYVDKISYSTQFVPETAIVGKMDLPGGGGGKRFSKANESKCGAALDGKRGAGVRCLRMIRQSGRRSGETRSRVQRLHGGGCGEGGKGGSLDIAGNPIPSGEIDWSCVKPPESEDRAARLTQPNHSSICRMSSEQSNRPATEAPREGGGGEERRKGMSREMAPNAVFDVLAMARGGSSGIGLGTTPRRLALVETRCYSPPQEATFHAVLYVLTIRKGRYETGENKMVTGNKMAEKGQGLNMVQSKMAAVTSSNMAESKMAYHATAPSPCRLTTSQPIGISTIRQVPELRLSNRSFPAGSLPDLSGSFLTMPLVGGFSRGSPPFPRPFIPALLHTHLASPSSALKASLLRAAPYASLHSNKSRITVGQGSWLFDSFAYWSLSCVFIGCCPTPCSYGIREVFPCKSAIGSEACKAGIINCDPIAKVTSLDVSLVPCRLHISSLCRNKKWKWTLASALSPEKMTRFRDDAGLRHLGHRRIIRRSRDDDAPRRRASGWRNYGTGELRRGGHSIHPPPCRFNELDSEMMTCNNAPVLQPSSSSKHSPPRPLTSYLCICDITRVSLWLATSVNPPPPSSSYEGTSVIYFGSLTAVAVMTSAGDRPNEMTITLQNTKEAKIPLILALAYFCSYLKRMFCDTQRYERDNNFLPTTNVGVLGSDVSTVRDVFYALD
ncbi:hypothetical protein PR048_031366 [Dryococelus australis]|uniref:Uncharacterized protein n=1 Tax=Dryococelus australis TaxID=614101 RepID=A0ABQ9G525_9NEOP|nr:hypothetical protein PR048_031366 [Dryococelus australis]